jgi:hypothetical protein
MNYRQVLDIVRGEAKRRPEAVFDFLDGVMLAANDASETSENEFEKVAWLRVAAIVDAAMKAAQGVVPRTPRRR